MLHRALRSVAIMLGVWGILAGGFAGPDCVTSAQASDLVLRFDEIEAFVRTTSPRARIFTDQIAAAEAERDGALQWSNPALAYDHEQYDEFVEWQFTVNKRFEMPFNQSEQRSGWAGQIRSAELRSAQDLEDLMAELKSGYIRLRLLENYRIRLARLQEFVVIASGVADSRHQEGEISGIDQKFIQLSGLSIDAVLRRVRRERREYGAAWRAEMGIPSITEVELGTSIVFQPVELATEAEYAAGLADRPGLKAKVVLTEALGQQADGARPSLVPAFDVYGGYKRFDPGFNGWVAGVAMDLPFFDRKAGASRQYEAQQRIAENELTIAKSSTRSEIASLVELIEDVQPTLTLYSERCDEIAPLTDTLLVAYREGSLSLDAFLNSIQIETGALENYYDLLNAYYGNIMRLEALTGLTIVTFADVGE